MARAPRKTPAASDTSPAAPAKPAPQPAAMTMTAGGTGGGAEIRVRMYRHGLGDCFVVSLIQPPRDPFHIMIDCGVILGTPGARDRLTAVLDDIIKLTGGHVDVLVVTHEHYDHVSGFVLCGEKFAAAGKTEAGKLSVGKVWFAWTEKPGDAFAQQLRDQRQKRKEALSALVNRLHGMGAAGQDGASEIVQALRFFGVDATGSDSGGTDGGAAAGGATQQAMAFAKQLSSDVTFWEPGQAWTSDSAPGIKVYMLGPPRDDAALHKTGSTTEVYHLDAGMLEAAVDLAGDSGQDGERPYAPFAKGYGKPLSDIVAGKPGGPAAQFIKDRYLGPGGSSPATDVSWRRIDDAWLDSAEQLALALDSATNNTSLALAIELTGSGKVLLFPADAQVGNWLSWQALQWKDGDRTVTTADLLARTRFYKVGHHGSHNATLKMKGLELMPASGLVAFIPVDEAMAKVKRWMEMPLPHLLDALHEHCGDAVIRIDKDLDAAILGLSSGGTGGPFGSLYHEWVQAL